MRTTAPRTAPVQARVTRPGDALERDADRMADAALAGAPATLTQTAWPDTVMRQAADDRSERDFEDDDFDVAAAARPGGPLPAPTGFLDTVRSTGGGHGLAAPQRGRFEQGFGRPLDHVRVHDDATSSHLADRINARAFTHGSDIFFAHGEHRPGSADGDRLLAHELAHTLQRPGAGTVARQPKKKQRAKQEPAFDPSRLTDEQKIEKRLEIYNEAVDMTDAWLDEFKADPTIDAAQRTRWTKALDDAIASASGITEPRQHDVRLAFLQAERDLFKDDFLAWTFQRDLMYFEGGEAAIARVGDPAATLSEADLAVKEARTPIMRAGVRPYLTWVNQTSLYQEKGIKPKDLETEEKSEQEVGTGAPTASTTGADAPQTFEDRKVMEELHAALSDLAIESASPDDSKLLAAELRKLTKEQRKDFYSFMRQLIKTSSGTGQRKGVLAGLGVFTSLDSASREALTVNRKMTEAAGPGAQEGLPKSVLLDVQAGAAEGRELTTTIRSINDNLDLIRHMTRDPEAQKKLEHVSLDLGLFHTEITMIRGLLGGGANKSSLVKEVGGQLISEIAHLEDDLLDQLQTFLKQLIAAELFAAVTEGLGTPAVLALLKRIEEIKALLDRLRHAYEAFKRIEHIVDIVRGIGGEYTHFLHWYERAAAVYAKVEAELEKLESAEDLEQALEAEEEQLFSELERMLEGKLGPLLEMLYIPADTSYEELREILFKIPTGLTALGDMWSHYRDGDKNDEKFEEVLGIKAFYAGELLFPFVGLMAALIAKGIQAAFPSSSIQTRVDKMFAKREGGRVGSILEDKGGDERRKRNRGLFGRVLRRRSDDYDKTSFVGVLGLARARLDTLLEAEAADEEEPSHHWAPAWFKLSVRSGMKEVNRRFQTEKQTVLSADKGTQLPVPRLHVRVNIPRFGTSRTMSAEISGSSPKAPPLEKVEYSYDDLKGAGVKLTSKDPRRPAAVRRWLSDEGYLMTEDEKRNPHLRLPGAKEQSQSGGSYVHIEKDRVKAGIDKDAYAGFLGRKVVESNQLPEGYYMVSLHGEDTVSLKKRLAPSGYTTLGLEADRTLVAGKPTMPPKTIAKGQTVKPDQGPYKYLEALDKMFTRKPGDPSYRTDGKSRDWWRKQVEKTPGLKERPTRAKGRLGYVLRARAYGSRDLHIPELRVDDDRAHLIAMRFGGLDDYENVVPMLSVENQYRPPGSGAPFGDQTGDQTGKWYAMETDMADVYIRKTPPGAAFIDFTLKLDYPSMTTRRPNRLVASYQPTDAQGGSVGTSKTVTVEQ